MTLQTLLSMLAGSAELPFVQAILLCQHAIAAQETTQSTIPLTASEWSRAMAVLVGDTMGHGHLPAMLDARRRRLFSACAAGNARY